MINTISFFGLDTFENLSTTTSAPATGLETGVFAGLMGLPGSEVQSDTPAKEAPAEDPAILAVDPAAAASVQFVPVPVETMVPVTQPVNPSAGTAQIQATSSDGLCWDGTARDPNEKKDYGLSIFSNRRPITDAPGAPVHLPPMQNPRINPITDQTVTVKDGKPVDPSIPGRLPPQEPSIDTRDTTKDKDFDLAVLTGRRPIVDTVSLRRDLAPPLAPKAYAGPRAEQDTIVLQPAAHDEPQPVKIPDAKTAQTLPTPVTSSQVADPVRNGIDPDLPLTMPEFHLPDEIGLNPGDPATLPPTAGNLAETIPVAEVLAVSEPQTREFKTVRPLADPGQIASFDQTMLRAPFQTAKTKTPGGDKEPYAVGLSKLFRSISESFDSLSKPAAMGEIKTNAVKIDVPVTEAPLVMTDEDTLPNVVLGNAQVSLEDTPEPHDGGDANDPIVTRFDKFLQAEALRNNGVKMETTTDPIKDASDVIKQVRPELLELAALTARKNEKQSMKMRLHPADLGTVEISLERSSTGALSAHFKTETEGARHALTNNMEQLRTSLQNAGWQVAQLEISSSLLSSTPDQNSKGPTQQFETVGSESLDRTSEQADAPENDPDRLLNLRA